MQSSVPKRDSLNTIRDLFLLQKNVATPKFLFFRYLDCKSFFKVYLGVIHKQSMTVFPNIKRRFAYIRPARIITLILYT